MKNQIILHLSRGPITTSLTERYSFLEAMATVSVSEKLISSIIHQQLSTKVATKIYVRFLDLFESDFTDLEKLLSFDLATLRGVGLSRQKATYIQNVAEFFQNQNNGG